MSMIKQHAKKWSPLISSVGTGFAAVCTIIDHFCPQWQLSDTIKVAAVISLIIGTLFCVIASALSFGDSGKKIIRVEGRSLPKFFIKWYKKEGYLTLCCNDVRWLSSNTELDILPILVNKAKQGQLTLWLDSHEIDTTNAQQLYVAGADICSLPDDAIDAGMVFSIREYRGHKWCILRHKSEDGHNPDTITVHKLNSNAYVSILEGYCKLFGRETKYERQTE